MATLKKLDFEPRSFEQNAWKNNKLVCGIDEAGRGAFAGPLVVGAAILPINASHNLLQDSKILTEEQRNQAYSWIMQHCMSAYALCSHRTIDTINIYQATLQTMQKAFFHLIHSYTILHKLESVLVDAMPLKLTQKSYNKLSINYFNYGEQISPSIAAASIVAKVTRDRLMKEYAQSFPLFDFPQHKGYGTTKHTLVLNATKPSLIHRKTFITKIKKYYENVSTQHSLF